MDNKPILILGGYGSVGQSLSRLLLRETPLSLVIAGRRQEKAAAWAAQLNEEFPGQRAEARPADASEPASLAAAFRGVRMVMVLTTTPGLVRQIGAAALDAGCDYLDILVTESTFADLQALAPAIEQQRRVFITQAGFHPGLPAVLLRQAAPYFDHYERASIAIAMNARFERPEQAAELIPLLSDFRADICEGGVWRKASFRDAIRADMGGCFGNMPLYPMQMPEIRHTQALYGLQDTGVYISGFNPFVDNVLMPLIWISQRIRKGLAVKFLQKLFVWGVNRFASPCPGVAMLNEAEGLKAGKRRRLRLLLSHPDAYAFTAIPLAACILQYLDGSLPPGLWMMGHNVDPPRLLCDMERMGIAVSTEIREKKTAATVA